MDDELARQLDEQMAEAKRAFIVSLPERVGDIEGAWRAFAAGDEEARGTFHRRVHSLRGTAATLGFAALAEEASALEQVIATPATQALTAELRDAIGAGVEAVGRAAKSCAG